MSDTSIKKLTPVQEALIPLHAKKWTSLAFSTDPIDRQKTAEAVKTVYALYWEKEPKILFFDSLYEALKDINVYVLGWEECDQLDLLGTLECTLYDQLSDSLHNQLHEQLLDPLCDLLHELWNPLLHQFFRQPEISHEVADNFAHDVNPQYWIVQCSFIDFCVSVLNCYLNPSERNAWEALQLLVKNCGWIYHFADRETDEVTCVVCDRPIKLSFDRENRLHAEGEPAIVFADGYSLYCYHGVRLPEEYEKLPPFSRSPNRLIDFP